MWTVLLSMLSFAVPRMGTRPEPTVIVEERHRVTTEGPGAARHRTPADIDPTPTPSKVEIPAGLRDARKGFRQ